MGQEYFRDPLENFIERYPHPLDPLFYPKTIAVIGAKDTPGSVGRTLMLNLLNKSFSGEIYPINPKRKEVFGKRCYENIRSIGVPIDLAVIVTPAETVPGIIRECVLEGVKTAIIISAGFKEIGPSGLLLEEAILREARNGDLRIIGPNCLGVMNPISHMNATFAKNMAAPGNIAFISQSGAMCTAVLDWSSKVGIGFSSFVSIGSMLDIGWGDLLDYFAQDPNTVSILMYMETTGDARSFLSAAREIALDKPIIVIKPGRSQEASKAAASHTGSLSGSDEVFDAALERVGVLRVDSIAELFNMAQVLGKQPKPKGPRIAIITNAGGPAVLATDTIIMQGALLAPLSSQTVETLDTFLPKAWSHANPVDILGDASAKTYRDTVDVLSKDPENDGILVVLSPQEMTEPIQTAEALREYADISGKPILASFMGGSFVQGGIDILAQANIPVFSYPDEAANCFAKIWRYTERLKDLYKIPLHPIEPASIYVANDAREKAKKLIESVRKENRVLLTESESKELLEFYDLPIVTTRTATTEEEAVEAAILIGYPVVLKLLSKTITHKSDIGGVQLNLKTEKEVREAFKKIKKAVSDSDCIGVTVQEMITVSGYELILGSSVDPQFGPVILFGSGGTLVEVFKDSALGLPPLSHHLAERLMEKTKIYKALQGVRGKKPVDLEALNRLLVRFSLFIADIPSIKECDINPLLVSSDRIVALDARVLLHEESAILEESTRLAIRPYPMEYIAKKTTKDGLQIIIRPICPEDEGALSTFHKDISEHSVVQRYTEYLPLEVRIAHERLIRICCNDYDREIPLVAALEETGAIIAVGRMTKRSRKKEADIKIIVQDAYQKKGIGALLLEGLLNAAKKEGIEEIFLTVLSSNKPMLEVCKKFGFLFENHENPLFTTARKTLFT